MQALVALSDVLWEEETHERRLPLGCQVSGLKWAAGPGLRASLLRPGRGPDSPTSRLYGLDVASPLSLLHRSHL